MTVIDRAAQQNKTVFKHNFVDFIRNFVPDVYIDEDINLSGVQNDRMYELLEQFVQVVDDFSGFIYVSGFTSTEDVKPLFSVNSVYNRIESNTLFDLFKINVNFFDLVEFSKLTVPETIRKYELNSIKAAEEFFPRRDFRYLITEILNNFTLNSPSPAYVSSLESTANTLAAAHTYLFNNYGWIYVLNTDQPFDKYSQYKTPRDYLIDKLEYCFLTGNPFTTQDGVEAFMNFIWNSRVI